MIWNVYRKELKDSLRDRKTLLLGILIPMIMMFGMTIFMDKKVFAPPRTDSLTIAVPNDTPQQALQLLSQIPNIQLQKSGDAVADVSSGKATVALIVDSHYAEYLEQARPIPIGIYADQSSMSVSRSVEYLQNQLNAVQVNIVNQRLHAKGLTAETIQPFQVEVKKLSHNNDESLGIISSLIPIIIMMSVMLGSFPSAIELFAGEKERKTMESLLITPVNRLHLLLGKFFTLSTIGMISGIVTAISFILFVQTATDHMAASLNLQEHLAATAGISVLVILLFSVMFAAMATVVSLIAKNFKEAQSYFGPLMMIVMIPYMLLLGVAPNEIPAGSYLIPVYNVFSLLKVIVYGVPSVNIILLVAVSTVITMLALFSLGNWMYKKDRWVL
jgi:sodium transport system permease protein